MPDIMIYILCNYSGVSCFNPRDMCFALQRQLNVFNFFRCSFAECLKFSVVRTKMISVYMFCPILCHLLGPDFSVLMSLDFSVSLCPDFSAMSINRRD